MGSTGSPLKSFFGLSGAAGQEVGFRKALTMMRLGGSPWGARAFLPFSLKSGAFLDMRLLRVGVSRRVDSWKSEEKRVGS